MVPSVHARSPCGWTEQWRTPSDPHSAPPEGRTPSAGVGGTSHWTGSLKVEGKNLWGKKNETKLVSTYKPEGITQVSFMLVSLE